MADRIRILNCTALISHCIDNQVHLAILDHVYDVRTSLRHLVYRSNRQPRCVQYSSCTASSIKRESQFRKIASNFHHARLIRVAYAYEDLTRERQFYASGQLRFDEGLGKGLSDSHHFAGGLHFGSQYGIHSGKLDKRKDRFLD